MSDDTLLPRTSTPLERGFEAAARRLTSVPVPLRDLWNPATCPAHLLPWLAWAFSVDDWDNTWTIGQQRAVIAASVGVHRRKGTIGAVKAALAAAGFGDAEVIETLAATQYDGTTNFDGSVDYAAAGHWAEYRVRMARPLSVAQAARIRTILASVAPARCHLDRLDFTESPHLYDAAILYDGTFAHGAS